MSAGAHAILDECYIRGNAQVTIGSRSSLSGPIRIVADVAPVTIGKFCSLAPQVAIWESEHRLRQVTSYFILSEIFGEEGSGDVETKGPVTIGNDVWIGTRAVILSGVTIGDGAVIGAGSVVTRDVPPFAVAVGVPAVVVRSRFPEPICGRLAELQWWNWDEDRILRNRALFASDLTPEALDRIA